ncbi:hypothetical protein I4641_00275 [Waterburya agarophytonicola K14]|uniref:Calcium-binding protein n=1 Tax=Waterburya agarophytonicola KI4 TaxID=2874699 RepID=A0A964BMM7_9CYAN|nr:hypothetical protein [Waterburya agarophytonicola]MCC0175416.1 hypothetical protein [Waterburya agarophytonicola KI4]
MSTIVSPENTDFLQETPNADGGINVVGQQGEENIIEIKGDAKVGINGGSMMDMITTGAGDAKVFAGGGDDVITGGAGDDTFRGGIGDDIIKGGVGADFIAGGAGNDVLIGGFGGFDDDGNPVGDTLRGGTGDDIFQFVAAELGTGVDTIVDFKDDGFADTIKIFGLGATDSVDYNTENGIVSVNGQEAIDIGGGQDVTIEFNADKDSWELL